MDIVVIGGGMAGARLAQQLAPYEAGRLTLVTEEPHPAYNRVLLAEVLAGRYGPEMIALPAAGTRLPARAVRLDRPEHVVICDDGSVLHYDRLVLATGSNPVLPPLRGLFEEGTHELPAGVHAFRTMDDCLALSAAVREGTRVVVVGGGLLGVSAAQALADRGAQVVIAQQGEHLMERHLDAPAAALLRTHLEAQGVEVHTECRVRGIRTQPDPGPAGRAVRSVELADGYCLGADLVVLACGIRPRIGLAQAAGLDVAKGVVVDDELRTSDPAIFAIGDCAQHAGTVYGLAGAARDQADVLARVLAHERGLAPTTPHTANPRPSSGHPAAPTASSPHAAGNDPAAGAPAATAPAPGAPRYLGTRALTRLTLRPMRDPSGTGTGTANGPAPESGAAFPAATAPGPVSGPTSGSGTDPASGSAPGTDPRAGAAGTPFDLAAFGDPVPVAGDDVLRLADATRGAYRKVVVRGDRLVGGILLGDLAAVGAVTRTWEGDEPLPSAPLLHLLTDDGGF